MRVLLLVLALGPALAQGVHVVKPGETLYSLARRYGTSVEALAALNGLSDPNRIRAGQKLVIPRPEDWPRGFSLSPYPLVQGRPVWVRVPNGARKVRLDGVAAPVLGGRALLPVGATAAPGLHGLFLDGRRVPVAVVPGGYGTRDLTLKGEKAGLFDRAQIRRERARILAACPSAAGPARWREPWQSPVPGAPVSAPFGERRRYNGRPGGYHAGMDLAAPAGAPVLAPAPGRVVLAEAFAVRGKTVVLAHGRGVCSILQHLSRIGVSPGESVRPGKPVGAVGSTGLSTGPHLHFEVRVLGVPQDPRAFLEEAP